MLIASFVAASVQNFNDIVAVVVVLNYDFTAVMLMVVLFLILFLLLEFGQGQFKLLLSYGVFTFG